tara:strand:+ start:703 stop:903 length:201 start_codon:yes stop_codon:yes gene_type:complete
MSKLIFQLADNDVDETSSQTIYIPERKKSSKKLVMIKQRIGDFEQTIYAPITQTLNYKNKKRRYND